MTVIWLAIIWFASGLANALYHHAYEPKTGKEQPIDLAIMFCIITVWGLLGVILTVVEKIFEAKV